MAVYPLRSILFGNLIVLLVFVHAGCSNSGSTQRGQKPTRSSRISEAFDDEKIAALERELKNMDEFIDSEIEGVIEKIGESEDAAVRRAVLQWQAAIMQMAIDDDDFEHPVAQLLDLWAATTRIEAFFVTGNGKTAFGDKQAIINEMTSGLNERVDTIARKYIPDSDYTALKIEVARFAEEHPVRSLQGMQTSADFSQSEAVASTIELQFEPLWWIGGVRQSLDPTLSLSQSVDSFTELAGKYPVMLRTQAKLLLMDVNQTDSVIKTADSIERLATSSERYADIAEQLPQQLREESTTLINDSHEAIKTVDSALGKAERLGATLDGTVNEFAKAGEVWVGTADAVTRTIEQIQRWTPYVNDPNYPRPKPRAPGEKPKFDINDYTRVAEAVGETSVQVQGLLADVRDFVDGESPGTNLARVNALAASLLDPTAAYTRDLVDLITYRAAQLVALIFLLATVYLFISRRLVGVGRPA